MMSREDFLKPRDVHAILRYPSGRTIRSARAGLLPHVVLPDGEICYKEMETEQVIVARHRKGEAVT